MSAIRRKPQPRWTLAANGEVLDVPAWVCDLETFVEWRTSGDVPEKVQICYLNGLIWVDADMEEVFTHNQVKFAFIRALGNIAVAEDLGRLFPDGVLLVHKAANLSCEPDCSFVAHETFDAGRVTIDEGKHGAQLVVRGSPDVVLEVVSRTSVKKDTVKLRRHYWRAGIPEFWLVDARDGLHFDILKRGAAGYTATRKQGGWLKSAVFGRSFRLTATADRRGQPDFRLDVR